MLKLSVRLTKAFLIVPIFLISTGYAQQVTWGFKVGGSGIDYSQRAHLDVLGNVYLSGEFTGTNVDFDPSPTTALQSSNGQRDAFVAKYSSSGQYILSITFGGGNLDKVNAVGTDAAGNIYVTGYFRGANVDFDPSPGTAFLSSNGDAGGDPGYGGDIFVAKYSSTGQYIWAFNVGGSLLGDAGVALKCDAAGNVYVGGYFREAIDFDPSPATAILDANIATGFLAKYNTNGQYQWAMNFGQGGNVDNSVFDLELDASLNVYMVGYFQGANIDFDPSPATAFLTSAGNFEGFLAKYTAAGQYVFAFKIGGGGPDVVRGIDLDNASNIYITGDFNGANIDFDPSAGAALLSSNGASDIFLAKYTSSGQYTWAINAGSSGGEISWDVATDDNSVYVTGGFTGIADFNPSAITDNLTSNGGYDIFLAKYTSAGVYECAFNIGSSQDDDGFDVQIGGNSIFYLAGAFQGTNVDFAPTPSTFMVSSNGNYDAFLMKYYWPPNTFPTGTFVGDTICQGQTAQLTFNALTGTSPFTITYSDGISNYTQTNIQNGVPFNVFVNPTATTVYSIIVIQDAVRCSPANNLLGLTATVIVGNPFVRTINDTTICTGGTVQLNATGAQTYSWSPTVGLSNPLIANPVATIQVPTQYIVTGTTANGCVGSDTINIGIHPQPGIAVTNDTLICKNTPVQLSATGGQSYSWTPSGTLNNPSSATPIATPATNTLYYVSIADINTCSYLDSVLVTVRPDAVFSINAASDICLNRSVQLLASGGDSYLWQPAAGLDQYNIANPSASPVISTIYVVTITENTCNQSQTLTTAVNVNPQPQVSVTKSNDIDCSIDKSQLNASGALQYTWSPSGSLNNPSIANPVATPNTNTDYFVIGTDAKGCSDTAMISIKVIDGNKGGYLVPSAFTPNSDGLNDCFRVSHWGVIQKMEFRVYNRWGQLVFFTTDPNQCWDGTFNGKKQDPGVFVYWIRANTSCEPQVFRKGTVVLIR